MNLRQALKISLLCIGAAIGGIYAVVHIQRALNERELPGGKPLNGDEIALAYSIFGKELKTESIRKVFSQNADPENRACVMPYSRTHVHLLDSASKCADFSRANHDQFNTIIHEFNHLLENQTFSITQLMLFKNDPKTDYFDVLDPKKSFYDYNFEQRSYMLADYATYYLHPAHHMSGEMGFSPEDRALIKRVIEERFPQAKITREAIEAQNPTPAQQRMRDIFAKLYVEPDEPRVQPQKAWQPVPYAHNDTVFYYNPFKLK